VKRLYVVTACVAPRGTPTVARADPQVRQRDYATALRFWAGEALADGHGLLVVENSGWDPVRLLTAADVDPARVPVLSYVEDEAVQARGKGNGEALMLRRAMDWIDAQGDKPDVLVKVTGRLVIPNQRRALAGLPSGRFLRCQVRGDLREVDTRFFATDVETWRAYLCDLEPQVREAEDRYLEHAVASKVSGAVYDGVRRDPFPTFPRYVGRSGSFDIRYPDGPKVMLRDALAVRIGRYLQRRHF